MKYVVFDENLQYEVKENTDFLSIFDDLDIEYGNEKGHYIDFICPFHQDKNFGSAKYDTSKNKCTCYACSRGITGIDLYMNAGYSYREAFIKVAVMSGISIPESCYEEGNKKSLKRLKREERVILGFEKEKKFIQISEDDTLLVKNLDYSRSNIMNLVNDEPQIYKSIVVKKCKEKELFLQKRLDIINESIDNSNQKYLWEKLKAKTETTLAKAVSIRKELEST